MVWYKIGRIYWCYLKWMQFIVYIFNLFNLQQFDVRFTKTQMMEQNSCCPFLRFWGKFFRFTIYFWQDIVYICYICYMRSALIAVCVFVCLLYISYYAQLISLVKRPNIKLYKINKSKS